MGYTNEHMGRIPQMCVPGTGQFLNSTLIITNQSSDGSIYIMRSSQKEFVDNIIIHEPLGSSDHNQLHFNIKIKSSKGFSER